MSWADELWLYQRYWRDSFHRSTIELNTVYGVQLSGVRWTRTRRLAVERGHKASRMRKLITHYAVNRWLCVMI